MDPSAPTARSRFKTIFTVLDSDPRARARLDAAIAFAQAQDAHLTVLCLGYEPNVPPFAFGEAAGLTMVDVMQRSRGEAEARGAEAAAAIEKAGIRGDAIPRTTIFRETEHVVADFARFADVAVVSAPFGADVPAIASEILDGILYESDVPALVLPAPNPQAPDTTRILIGWDGGRQALRAVRAALPLLTAAEGVEICMFAPRGEAPGERLATLLSRHGVSVEIATLPEPQDSVATAMARRAQEQGAGLVVMGAYGHSRFRESLIGGATRETLHELSLPVLMAH
ncbi:MAG: universal stress protein [Pseudomonadota bacterium]